MKTLSLVVAFVAGGSSDVRWLYDLAV